MFLGVAREPALDDATIKEQIIRAGDPNLFRELEIPRSMVASWIRRGLGEVVSLDEDDGGGEVISRDRYVGSPFTPRCGSVDQAAPRR